MFDESEVATTRIKKIKKLIHLSKKWIRTIGFLEFIRLATHELHNQKLSLFEADKISEIQKILSEKHFDNYIQWITNHTISKQQYSKIHDELDNLESKPIFHIIFLEFDQEFLQSSIESLKNQLYANWDYHILNNNSKSYGKFEDKILSGSSIQTLSKILKFHDDGYFLFLYPGDKLHDDSLYLLFNHLKKNKQELIIFDHDDLENNKRTNPFFKPDWSLNLFLSMNYIDRAFAIKSSLFNKLSNPFSIYDLLLQATEKTDKITHLCSPILSLNKNKTTAHKNDIESLQTALERRKINGKIITQENSNFFRLKYNLNEEPKVSIIIPTKDNIKLLKRCINTLEKKTRYKNLEIIIVDNKSVKNDTLKYYQTLHHKIISYNGPFNFSTLINKGALEANGKFLLLLNDDVAAIEPDWLSELVSICSQDKIGVVGPKLIYKNNTIQHAGMVFLKTGAGFHPYNTYPADHQGYFGFMDVIRDYSAVTGACLLTKKKLFERVNGLNEIFDLYYGDSDYCLKVRDLGYDVVYTPYATLIHDGSSKTKEISKEPHFAVENHYHFIQRWSQLKNGDPFYNPNLGWNYSIHV